MYKFKEIRERRRISQKEVALTLGVKAPSVSEWENGKSNPTIENLIRLAELYRVSVDELLGRDAGIGGGAGLTAEERRLISVMRSLNQDGQDRLLQSALDFADLPRYTQDATAVVS